MNNLHKSKINNNILIQESAGHTVEERLNYDKNVDCKKFLKAFTKQFELVQEGCSEKKIRLSAVLFFKLFTRYKLIICKVSFFF
jgi:predicted transglutaminase-like cysteine proteinase